MANIKRRLEQLEAERGKSCAGFIVLQSLCQSKGETVPAIDKNDVVSVWRAIAERLPA